MAKTITTRLAISGDIDYRRLIDSPIYKDSVESLAELAAARSSGDLEELLTELQLLVYRIALVVASNEYSHCEPVNEDGIEWIDS